MAVVSTKILHDGWRGSFTTNEIPTFSVVYLVEVDDPEDGNLLVVDAAGIPKLGAAYSVGQDFHAGVRCKSLSTSPVGGTRNLWQVTASFGKPEKGEEEDDPNEVDEDGEPTDDPLEYTVSMSISSTRVTRDAINGTYLGQVHDVEGVAGNLLQGAGFKEGNPPPASHDNVTTNRKGVINNGRPITNSVFAPFDPPAQVEYNRTNIKIKFNTADTPVNILPYINSVNSKTCKIKVKYKWRDEDGATGKFYGRFKIPIYAGRIMGLTTHPAMRNGIGYHENELEIEVDKLYTWRLDILDRGYATLDTDKTFNPGGNSQGKSAPVTKAVTTEDGFASREPVLLDGMGQALEVQEANDGVYLRYGVYPEMDWNIVGVNRPEKLKEGFIAGD